MRPGLVAGALALFVLLAALAEAAVLYWVDDPTARLSLGLLLLPLIYWAATRIALAERAVDLLTPRLHPRRFHRLRAEVTELLDEIRRLNRIASAQGEGTEEPPADAQQVDDLEEKLKAHIDRIRESVGRPGPTE